MCFVLAVETFDCWLGNYSFYFIEINSGEKLVYSRYKSRLFTILPIVLSLPLGKKMRLVYLLFLCVYIAACQPAVEPTEQAKEKIIETLQLETKYFCERNLAKWQDQWSHKSFVSKMYAGEKDFEEFTSWNEINQFTVHHIADFPESIPIPVSDQEYDIYLFAETAWVFYTKEGETGPVRETRFMVNERGKWKIERMQTIY